MGNLNTQISQICGGHGVTLDYKCGIYYYYSIFGDFISVIDYSYEDRCVMTNKILPYTQESDVKDILPLIMSLDIPEDPLDRVAWMKEMASQLIIAGQDMAAWASIQLGELKREGYESEQHMIVPVFSSRKESWIDEDKLRDEHPDLWKKCLSLKPTEAAKLLGGADELTKIVIEKVGEQRVISSSNISMTKARKVLSAIELQEYVTESYPELEPEIVEKLHGT